MAMTNTATETYASLQKAYDTIQEFFDNNQFGPEHSAMINKHEELRDKLDALDIEAIENASADFQTLHASFGEIKKTADEMIDEVNSAIDTVDKVTKVVSGLDKVLTQVQNLLS